MSTMTQPIPPSLPVTDGEYRIAPIHLYLLNAVAVGLTEARKERDPRRQQRGFALARKVTRTVVKTLRGEILAWLEADRLSLATPRGRSLFAVAAMATAVQQSFDDPADSPSVRERVLGDFQTLLLQHLSHDAAV